LKNEAEHVRANETMRLVVIIPTIGRKALLPDVLKLFEKQERLPDEIIVSAPDESHAPDFQSDRFQVSYVFGRKGLCAQRNQALDAAIPHSDLITFFDDDFLPAKNYLARLENAFRENPDWVVIRGEAVFDGATGPGYTFEEGMRLLREWEQSDRASSPPLRVDNHIGAYGCNMSIRSAAIGELRFDERLPLYGWQEDIDFTSQLRARGRVVGLNTLCGVHLATKSGRMSGVRFGYSQVANAVYLVRKGTVPAHFAYKLMARNVAANIVRSVRPEPYIDRFGRLRGNLLAAYHILKGRVDPEHILRL
jgi:glycosyltransferase involved in cell wall biosynthesis